jgi:hypothetical protein
MGNLEIKETFGTRQRKKHKYYDGPISFYIEKLYHLDYQ